MRGGVLFNLQVSSRMAAALRVGHLIDRATGVDINAFRTISWSIPGNADYLPALDGQPILGSPQRDTGP